MNCSHLLRCGATRVKIVFNAQCTWQVFIRMYRYMAIKFQKGSTKRGLSFTLKAINYLILESSPLYIHSIWVNVLKSGNVRIIIIRHREVFQNFASYCTSLLFQLISKSRSSTSLAASVLFNCTIQQIFEDLYKHLCFCYYYFSYTEWMEYRLYFHFVF